MYLHINPHDEIPVYRQIHSQIAAAIADHTLEPGDALQAEDQLAARLVVSPLAVRKAYESLLAEGLCANSADGAYRVTARTPGSALDRPDTEAPKLGNPQHLTSELLAARETQKRLLPPSDIVGERWTLRARSFPAGALAGDFYDLIDLDEGGLGVVVGDVAGKGLAAGLIMAVVESTMPFLTAGRSVAAALQELNRRLNLLLGRRQFVALCYARFDPRRSLLEIANAGLPDPYLLRHDGTIRALSVAGERLPLGLKSHVSYSAACHSLRPGDRLLLLTDGIPEATGMAGEPIGYEGLARLLESSLAGEELSMAGGRLSETFLDRLLDEARSLTRGIPEDDWTVVLLDYHGS